MYTSFYNLRERPFNLTPDSHFLYLSPRYREALGHLLYGIRERKGFILVTGEVGTGKTTLCRALIAEIEKEAEVGFILNSFLSAEELLKTINEDLSCHAGAVSRKGLVDELNKFLLARHEAGRNVVVLIDEGQNLALPVLEQLRMLSNLETEKEKLLQIVLVGQPELREMLESPGLRQLAQRITVSYHLQPLSRRETARYISYRLSVAAGGGDSRPPCFTPGAVNRIYRRSRGLPRKINIICDRALLIGYVRGKRRITGEIARRAISEIEGRPRAGRLPAASRLIAGAACLAAAAIGAWHAAPPFLESKPGNGPRRQGAVATVSPAPSPAVGAARVPQEPVLVAEIAPTASPAPTRPPPPAEAPAVRGTDEAEAAAALSALWGVRGVRPETLGGTRNLHALAAGCGMKSVSCWGGVDFIRRVNLPCIISLRGGGGVAVRALVAAIRGGRAFLVLPGGEGRDVTAQEIEERICGQAVYYYPRGVRLPGALAPGMSGPDVRALQRGLRALGALDADEDGRYGPETAAAVARFQGRYGLPVDGVAGTGEWLLLKSLEAGGAAPRLDPGAPGG